MNNRTREFSDDVLDLSDQQVFEDTGLLSVNKNIDRPKPEKISFEAEDNDVIGRVWPLRILQLVGVWQPSIIPPVVAWLYYSFLVLLQIWYLFWIIYYVSVKFDFAVAILTSLETVIYFLLWLLVPYILSMKNENFINNTVDFAEKQKSFLLKVLCFAYFVCLVLIMVPQVAYFVLIEVPYISNNIVTALPWNKANPFVIANIVFLSTAKAFNILLINSVLLYLAICAHLQSFQINSLIQSYFNRIESVNPSHIKPVIYLAIQSLSEGNASVEPLNAAIVLSFILSLASIGAKLYLNQRDWSLYLVTPLLIMIVQMYFLLMPPAYITRCWDRMMQKILTLHALAPSQDQELTSIIIYLNTAYMGYTVTNIRIDASRVLYITFFMIALLCLKVRVSAQYFTFPDNDL